MPIGTLRYSVRNRIDLWMLHHRNGTYVTHLGNIERSVRTAALRLNVQFNLYRRHIIVLVFC